MNLDMTKELPDITDSRAFEWRAYWMARIAHYWSLGYVNPANYWRL